jgi:hypothetical protein
MNKVMFKSAILSVMLCMLLFTAIAYVVAEEEEEAGVSSTGFAYGNNGEIMVAGCAGEYNNGVLTDVSWRAALYASGSATFVSQTYTFNANGAILSSGSTANPDVYISYFPGPYNSASAQTTGYFTRNNGSIYNIGSTPLASIP